MKWRYKPAIYAAITGSREGCSSTPRFRRAWSNDRQHRKRRLEHYDVEKGIILGALHSGTGHYDIILGVTIELCVETGIVMRSPLDW